MNDELFEQKLHSLKQTIIDVNKELEDLRLDVQYLVFDLEATRRENAALRKTLDELNDPETGEL